MKKKRNSKSDQKFEDFIRSRITTTEKKADGKFVS
jgi:hypothetical protein